MSILKHLGIDPGRATIDWDLKPAETFGIFESWGGKERVRNKNERFYYFYIDNEKKPAGLFLMERGIKHAKVLAQIKAPQDMIDQCVKKQGKSTTLDTSYSIDTAIRGWLEENVVDSKDQSKVIPILHPKEKLGDTRLPTKSEVLPSIKKRTIRNKPIQGKEVEIENIIQQENLFDRHQNPSGNLEKFLADNEDGLTVSDHSADLMWMRGGCDINSIKTIENWVVDLNRNQFAGYDNWRLPTIDEGLSLLEKSKNGNGLYIHSCFSREQPFIFTSDRREPGGQWFIDFTQGRVYWASAFNPGGFGRVCRNIT